MTVVTSLIVFIDVLSSLLRNQGSSIRQCQGTPHSTNTRNNNLSHACTGINYQLFSVISALFHRDWYKFEVTIYVATFTMRSRGTSIIWVTIFSQPNSFSQGRTFELSKLCANSHTFQLFIW